MTNILALSAMSHDSEILLYELSGFNKSSPFDAFYFTAHDSVVYQGISYIPLACSIEGLEITSAGQLPTPTLAVSDKTVEDSQIITGLMDYYGGLEGSTIKVTQILRQNLDDGVQPFPGATKPIQQFQISQTKDILPGIAVVFELTTPLELLEAKVPVQMCLNKCQWRYRFLIECPYSGMQEWDIQGKPVPFGSPQAGCGKTIADCQLRFGQNAVLPTSALPALTRIG